MVETGFSSYCRVDILQELFANSSDLAFGRVNKSASGFVLKIVFMVFECYKSMSLSHTFCPFGNVQISSDVFGFVVNNVDCVSVSFLVAGAPNEGFGEISVRKGIGRLENSIVDRAVSFTSDFRRF